MPEVPVEEHGLDEGAKDEGDRHRQDEDRQDGQKFISPLQALERLGAAQPLPCQNRQDEGGRQEGQADEKAGDVFFQQRRQPQGGQEAYDHRGNCGHDLHHRLNNLANPRAAELAGIDGSKQGQGDGEEHRVDGPLDGAVNQWGQAQFRLEIIAGGGGLPYPCRPVVAFVPDLAEERLHADFGVGVVDRPYDRLPFRVHGNDPVPAGGEVEMHQCLVVVQGQQMALAGHVVEVHNPVAVEAEDRFIPLRGLDDFHRSLMAGQGVDLPKPPPARFAGDRKPGTEPPVRVPDSKRDVPQHQTEGGDRPPVCKSGGLFQQLRTPRIGQVPAQQGPLVGAGIEGASVAVDGQGGHPLRLRILQGKGVLLLFLVAEKINGDRLLDHLQLSVLSEVDPQPNLLPDPGHRSHRPPAIRGGESRQTLEAPGDGPPSLRIEDRTKLEFLHGQRTVVPHQAIDLLTLGLHRNQAVPSVRRFGGEAA